MLEKEFQILAGVVTCKSQREGLCATPSPDIKYELI
jgi:hypothetical protein